MLLLFVWNHSYFLARSLGSSRVQLLENIPSKLAWGTFCAKMPSNLLYYCLFLHNDLLLFGQVAAHLIQRSHTTQKHQLPTVHKMQIFIKEQQEQRIWPNFFLPSHLSCFLGIHYWVDHQIPWVHWRSSRWKKGLCHQLMKIQISQTSKLILFTNLSKQKCPHIESNFGAKIQITP